MQLFNLLKINNYRVIAIQYLPGHFNSFENENSGLIKFPFNNTCFSSSSKYINDDPIVYVTKQRKEEEKKTKEKKTSKY